MTSKRFIIEIGTGVDLHGEDVTKAACRAVKDAVSRSCLCGLVEILGLDDLSAVQVDIVVASPRPDDVDLGQVSAMVPIGQKTARSVNGGMVVEGLCVPSFAPDCDQIVVVNAAVTVFIS
ncbi:MAG: Lin0512 family protein [Anaerolineales bacterium]|nr:Lin0512 family protein [Anaerolineales bacterium]